MFSSDVNPVSFFSRFTGDRGLLPSNCKEMTFSKNAVILHQEEEGTDLYIIREGRVKVSLIHEGGREVVLAYLKEGDFFGELSFLDNRCRSAMVTAESDVRILFLSREAFLKTLNENTDVVMHLLSVMADRLRKSSETIGTLTCLDVAGRVSKLLLDMATSSGERLPDGSIKVQCPTHQAIANRIGASREAVTKSMKSLISNGLIATKGKEIIISPKQFEIL